MTSIARNLFIIIRIDILLLASRQFHCLSCMHDSLAVRRNMCDNSHFKSAKQTTPLNNSAILFNRRHAGTVMWLNNSHFKSVTQTTPLQ
jgi:hypothetical protein